MSLIKDYGICEECGKALDGIAYFTGSKICKSCIDLKHKKATGKYLDLKIKRKSKKYHY